ncbi:hypothetical protein KY290_014475 [Solanum tuberosum]|uniref:Uncharacterized protein n=1 Tax=Solanum tuberosum TaxID=4113 RepID=A0ABQ7VPU8_SOLTU|nr:hypothetical protein KY290_014475 [Solanum tuberosum]
MEEKCGINWEREHYSSKGLINLKYYFSCSITAYKRLDFLNRVCPRGLAVNSIGIKVEGLDARQCCWS